MFMVSVRKRLAFRCFQLENMAVYKCIVNSEIIVNRYWFCRREYECETRKFFRLEKTLETFYLCKCISSLALITSLIYFFFKF